ncbi:MAG: cob(I)yrinic acid a,c-diamide adenosyltransferase [Candidatus Omnitrophica bacterium]|nr:cob(I)yrinic acid a,c-diamide adenosyltransferase [Candidatus Omnitrophota bacterium]MDD5027349.1 cob(I)yrinic acid a,c-diamide adenosyltransferase [Candidatus Omnitrophota bacterium]MDD5661706.1 cob(I)yrinic acid a,c-diamide adenosyltransferase [Candidatus Omnitrophota bacterium]
MIQVYTGNGKGKTTAALGLALRAAGAGFKVYLGQFLKKGHYSEIASLKKLKNIKVEQFGVTYFTRCALQRKDVELAKKGLTAAKRAINSRRYALIVLDEINVALRLGLLSLPAVLAVIKKTPKKIELVLTGRSAHPAIIKIADLVSEVKERKHYYKKSVKARKGIEF